MVPLLQLLRNKTVSNESISEQRAALATARLVKPYETSQWHFLKYPPGDVLRAQFN